MRKLILFATVFLLSNAAFAQFKWGIKGGTNNTKLSTSESFSYTNPTLGDVKYTLLNDDYSNGFHIGLTTNIQIPIVGLYLQPEIYYSNIGSKVTFEPDGFNAPEIGSLESTTNRIDIPVLIGWRLGLGDLAGVRLFAGPVGSFVINDSFSDELKELTGADGDLDTRAMTWGLQGGLGVDLWRISLDARYEGGLNGVAKEFANSQNKIEFDSRANQWLISLGFWF